MKIIERPIAELIFAEYNPRQLSTDQYEHLKASLSRFGFVDPVIVNMHADRKNIIVGGHQRVKVWKDMGNATVPVHEIKLDEAQEQELNIRLNKNSGSWDWDELANQFDTGDLKAWGFNSSDLEGFDFDDEETPHTQPLSVQNLPAMAWCLIGVPLDSWQKASEHISAISKIENVFCEARVGNEQKDR